MAKGEQMRVGVVGARRGGGHIVALGKANKRIVLGGVYDPLQATSEEFANKDSELVACDVECRLAGFEGFYLELDIPGLDELIGGAR